MSVITSKPLITTIIPTYRRPKLLEKAIHSVLNQTYPNFQVCIYDNASGDDTASVVAEIAEQDSRVKYHCHPANIGAIDNFNYGMKKVTTPFFSLLSDDNMLLSNFFEDAINTLNKNPEAILFAGQTISVDEKGQEVGRTLESWEPGQVFPPDGLLNIVEKGFPSWESVLFRSEVISAVGVLDPASAPSVDQDFMMRIARRHIFYIKKKEYALFLTHKNSLTGHRDLIETVSSLKKRMDVWLKDEDLSEDLKERIKESSKIKMYALLRSVLICKGIFEQDTKTIAVATEIMRNEVGLSPRSWGLIIMARLANYTTFFRKLVLLLFHLYRAPRTKYRALKNKKWSVII